MTEPSNIIAHSLAQNPVQHVVSVGTVSAGVTGKMIAETDPVGAWSYAVSMASELAIFTGLFLTFILIYRAFQSAQIDRLKKKKIQIEIAELSRRKSDQINHLSDN